MHSSTVENYLKQIYLEQQAGAPGQLVQMGRLASAMGVVPGTATSMVKALADSGLVSYEPRSGARLTRGEQLALHVLRRHRLVELFLVKVLGLDWSEVHAEAEELEHVISEKVLEKIDALLDRPRFDPHGDPIPPARGKPSDTRYRSLIDCDLKRPLKIARVLDQNPSFLQFIDRCGLVPGTTVTVESREGQAAAVTMKPQGKPAVTLGLDAAMKVLVENA